MNLDQVLLDLHSGLPEIKPKQLLLERLNNQISDVIPYRLSLNMAG